MDRSGVMDMIEKGLFFVVVPEKCLGINHETFCLRNTRRVAREKRIVSVK